MNSAETESGGIDRDLALCLHKVLTAGADELFQLIQDPSMELLKAALKNPSFSEPHYLAILKRRDLSEDFLRAACQSKVALESHLVRVALAHHPTIPAVQLLALLPHLHLFEMSAICTLPGVTSDQKVAAERAIIQRLPTTPLGIKVTLAHRATSAVVEQLLKEGDSRLTAACLDSGRLKEGAVFQFLRGSAASPESISMIARHQRWQSRPNVRMAILSHPRTPLVLFTLWLPTMKTAEVRNLYESQRLSQLQRREVLEELDRRMHRSNRR
jgi:hypothetical protein